MQKYNQPAAGDNFLIRQLGGKLIKVRIEDVYSTLLFIVADGTTRQSKKIH